MTTIRTIAVHEIVRRTYPRPPPEDRDEIAMATGKAIDGTMTQLGHDARQGRRSSATALRTLAASLLDDALAEAVVAVPADERERILDQVRAVLQAYRRSPIFGLGRPRSRLIMIGGAVGVYAQPDFWDGRARIFEMKSFGAIPPRPDVALQLRYFQLAFPQFHTVLICFDRHRAPIEWTSTTIPPPTDAEAAEALRLGHDLGLAYGQEKVLEYLDGQAVSYALPPPSTGG